MAQNLEMAKELVRLLKENPAMPVYVVASSVGWGELEGIYVDRCCETQGHFCIWSEPTSAAEMARLISAQTLHDTSAADVESMDWKPCIIVNGVLTGEGSTDRGGGEIDWSAI